MEQTKYKVKEYEKSFEVHGGDDRIPFRISLDQSRWVIEDLHGKVHGIHGLYEISKIAVKAASIALQNWEPKVTPMEGFYKFKWGPEKLGRALGKIISGQFNRLKSSISPVILGVQKSIFASTFACGDLVTSLSFYKTASNYLISDIIKHRPAAVAARHLFSPWGIDCFSLQDGDPDRIKEMFIPCDEHFPNPIPYSQSNLIILNLENSELFRKNLSLLEKWPLLYSPFRETYTALNRTLMNCPPVPPRILLRVFNHRLRRPLVEKLEFILNVEAMDMAIREENKELLIHSTKEEIRLALKDLEAEIGPTFSSRKSASVSFLVTYINDSNEINPNGNLRNLVRKAIRWHHQNRETPKNGNIDPSTEVKKPPVVFPENMDGLKIRFLDTIGQIYNEGAEMKHCIATFANKAMSGNCYLFHVEDLGSGETASIEMNKYGRVIQSRGPNNSSNIASRKGELVLSKLGKEIRVVCNPQGQDEDLGGDMNNFDELPF